MARKLCPEFDVEENIFLPQGIDTLSGPAERSVFVCLKGRIFSEVRIQNGQRQVSHRLVSTEGLAYFLEEGGVSLTTIGDCRGCNVQIQGRFLVEKESIRVDACEIFS